MPAGFWLALAIVTEVIATSSLKAAAAFTKPLPSAVVIIGYSSAFYFLALALRTMPVGVAYALWSGFGVVLVTAIAWIVYGQKLDLVAMVGIALIIAGAVVLNLRPAAS
jgi:multidrug transporter EmrE-like cation transporter